MTICAAASQRWSGKLEDMGHPIRQEERSRVAGPRASLVPVHGAASSTARGVITSKTRERLDLLNGLRRGSEHCRPDATAKDDADYRLGRRSLQLLRELAK